jgi:hypothetical protein
VEYSEGWFVLQQGGSTCEWYGSMYESEQEAQEGIAAHKADTYDAVGPFHVQLDEPLAVEAWVAMADAMAEAAVAVANKVTPW